jgi:hypothetical protein
MAEDETTYTGADSEQLPEDTTPNAEDAAAARQKDYEQTVKWNDKDRSKPGIGS